RAFVLCSLPRSTCMTNPTMPIRSRAPAERGMGSRAARQRATSAIYLAPALAIVLLINIFPILYTFYLSLTNRNGPARFAEGNYQVTGFQNYTRLLGQADFYLVLGKTTL